MDLILDSGDRQVWVERIDTDPAFELQFDSEAYPCLIFANQPTSIEFKSDVAERLIDTGCMYMVCGGLECELWHDIIDEVIVELKIDGNLDQSSLIMTTWHTEATMEDLAFFFTYVTHNPNIEDQSSFAEQSGSKFFVLLVGDSDEPELLQHIINGLSEATS